MPLSPGWGDLFLRLALTALAGALIGLNRGERGRPAGLRTTMLVGLAASVAMIQVNLLLGMKGKTPDSFITNDLMRLPLGILSGMGFIGAGAILRRGDSVHGVTTAATLWTTTVIGLCFGGGQLALGLVATLLAFVILWGLKHAEAHLSRDQRATLCITAGTGPSALAATEQCLARKGCRSALLSLEVADIEQRAKFEICWHETADGLDVPALLDELRNGAGISTVEWLSRGAPPS